MSDNDRYALLVGVSTYDSARYHELPAVRADLHYMQAVLESTEIGMYNDCAVVAEPTRAEMLRAIEDFLGERQASETALVYFSGHGEFCEQDNQLYFLTRDSDPADLPGTAVSAEFLERMLQDCRAASKIVLLDCCSSGSVVQGWTAKGATAEELRGGAEAGRSTLLHPTGVYFITASDALQVASAMAPEGSSLGTSRFTGEIVEGLRNGRIKDSGWITPDDLFTFLTQQMTSLGVPEEQRPTKSTIRATRDLVFARSVAQPVFLPPLPGAGPAGPAPSPALLKARARVDSDAQDGVDWKRLLQYYLACIAAESASAMLPDRDRGEGQDYVLHGSGKEEVQAGLARSLAAPALPRGRDADKTEYWYGYPVVTLPAAGGRRGKTAVRVAPLLIQRMERSPDPDGRDVLRPAGVPSVHAGLLAELLTQDEAGELAARWQPTWQDGNSGQMLKAVRQLLTELHLPELEPLDISVLNDTGVRSSLRRGAHNAAMLLLTSGADKFAEGLVGNLTEIAAKADQISRTALGALLAGSSAAADPEAQRAVTVVAAGPSNESQQHVVRAAMTQPVTVATGPPGTGKSEVVTAVVTTGSQAGQTVLVASTNNEAVNVVAARCDDIAPGLMMRTGNVEARGREAEKLERLLREPPEQPARNSATAMGELRHAWARSLDGRRSAAEYVRAEGRLADLLRTRAAAAQSLGIQPEVLAGGGLGSGDLLRQCERRARRALRARVLAGLRRARAARAFVRAVAPEVRDHLVAAALAEPLRLALLADLCGAEADLRALTTAHERYDEQQLGEDRLRDTARITELSREAAGATSAERLRAATEVMNRRLQSLRQQRGFQKSQKQLMAQVKGWGISTHSVRQLELSTGLVDLVVIDEASQCSIPAVLPLLFRAERVLVIGDPMQLGHIASISPEQERQARERAGLSAAWLEEHQLSYRTNSVYDAASRGTAALLLDEHYRCHPEIADVVNGYCYAGRLRVLTDVRGHVPPVDLSQGSGRSSVLTWVDVPDGASAPGEGGGSWRNQAEAAAVERVVAELRRRLPAKATIGVVTPFRAQKEDLERRLREYDVRVGTVHAFQGGQRDVMVLSLVAAGNTPAGTAHWVGGQVNLWNVAITRAKSQLITVGTHGFWQEHPGLPAELARRSTLVAAAGADRRPTGAAPLAAVPSPGREALADRLQAHLGDHGHHALERGSVVGGHPVDLLVTGRDPVTGEPENIAVLIDEGPAEGEEPARHLRLVQARGELLVGLPSGGYGAKAGPVARWVRVPAWLILSGRPVPGLTD
ncbi:AAA domain-containing protein [Kitasatospora sp. NPDC002040]|uniref:caspase, EACC1-associated type n=1 Tax=Kitasatospora sp. NPDC002040 TaxID=3154661 RepID=UPI00332E5157